MSIFRRPLFIVLAILIALAAIEGIAWWWMTPAPVGIGEPVLAYQPQVERDQTLYTHFSQTAQVDTGEPEISGQITTGVLANLGNRAEGKTAITAVQHGDLEGGRQEAGAANVPVRSSSLVSAPTHTLLSEIVSSSIRSLRCSTGTAVRIDRDDGTIVHVAFFEWDLAASNNVLEAFKHLPDECMGTIGMTLVKIHPPRMYVVRSQELLGRDLRSALQSLGGNGADVIVADGARSERRDHRSEDGSHEEAASTSSASSSNHQSPISNISLNFDHTEFRDLTGRTIHAFKGVWVSGVTNLLGDGPRGGLDQSRQIRWRAALKRFRPAHARVAQGAVSGIASSDRAWETFEESMLRDLTLAR